MRRSLGGYRDGITEQQLRAAPFLSRDRNYDDGSVFPCTLAEANTALTNTLWRTPQADSRLVFIGTCGSDDLLSISSLTSSQRARERIFMCSYMREWDA